LFLTDVRDEAVKCFDNVIKIDLNSLVAWKGISLDKKIDVSKTLGMIEEKHE